MLIIYYPLLFFITIFNFVHLQELQSHTSENENGTTLSHSFTKSNDLSSTEFYENQTEFNQFWDSIHRIEANTDKQFISIADQIRQLSAELNQSSSVCYQIIEKAFRNGLQEKWSAQCK